jgi:uncharacterized protein YndB with AHSA1/START domain
MRLSLTTVIDRPPAVVWEFFAVNHVRNHPRWDPKMELRQLTEGPIGVGTRIHRRSTRTDPPTEGIMEVVEFEPESVMGMVIRDNTPAGPLEMHSRMRVEPAGERHTRLTGFIDVPTMEAPMDPSPIEASLSRMKELIEAETPAT